MQKKPATGKPAGRQKPPPMVDMLAEHNQMATDKLMAKMRAKMARGARKA